MGENYVFSWRNMPVLLRARLLSQDVIDRQGVVIAGRIQDLSYWGEGQSVRLGFKRSREQIPGGAKSDVLYVFDKIIFNAI